MQSRDKSKGGHPGSATLRSKTQDDARRGPLGHALGYAQSTLVSLWGSPSSPFKTTLGLSLPKPAAVGGHSNGTRILSAVGLKVVEAIEPDGNCGHRAVAFQLFGDQKRYSEIRSSVPGLLKARPELIDAWAAPFASELRLKKQRRELLGKTWTRCLAEIAKDRTYITYVELLVLRQYHNFPLVVLSVHKGHIEVHCVDDSDAIGTNVQKVWSTQPGKLRDIIAAAPANCAFFLYSPEGAGSQYDVPGRINASSGAAAVTVGDGDDDMVNLCNFLGVATGTAAFNRHRYSISAQATGLRRRRWLGTRQVVGGPQSHRPQNGQA